MDTATLRWILIIVGLIIVGAIFLFGNPDKKRKPKASRKKPAEMADRREPTLEGGPGAEQANAPEWGELGDDGDASAQRELDIDGSERPAKTPPKPRKPAGPPPDKIITLFLLASDNRVITGAELLQATVSTGMEFGDMNIFHRLPEGSDTPVFSLANAAKPGYFERDEWNTFETSGIALFMTLPGPVNALDGWDSMLAAARRIGEILHADLLDEQRHPFTRQTEAQLREEMREYDRQKS